jgi:hypothetical protein
MQNEIIKGDAYPFRFEGGFQNLYTFDTDNIISYDIRFKPCDYIFEGRLDFHVRIFSDFHQLNNGKVIIFICDSSDRRQEARRRKFNQWVELFKGSEFVKFDTEIIDPIGPIYHNSIILRTDNPYRDQIMKSFFDLADDYEK